MKTIKKLLMLSLTLLVIVSCASIPASTSTLSKEIIKEADGMHQLNISLVNQLYAEREQRINDFITYQYTPALLVNYQKLLPDSMDYKTELPNILQSIVPVINKKRDSLQGVLSKEQQHIIEQLNTNYSSYTTSSAALQGLIDSAVKLKASESNALTALENLTGVSSGTVSNIESKLEKLLTESGTTIDQLLQITNSLKQ
jgi:hypothetical protein